MCWGVGGGERKCGEVLGKSVEKCFWVWRCGGCGKCWGRCKKACWHVGKVREDVGGVGSVGGGVGKCVGVWGR